MCSVKIFDYKINADLNKNVFNLDLKIAKEGLSRISKGKHTPRIINNNNNNILLMYNIHKM